MSVHQFFCCSVGMKACAADILFVNTEDLCGFRCREPIVHRSSSTRSPIYRSIVLSWNSPVIKIYAVLIYENLAGCVGCRRGRFSVVWFNPVFGMLAGRTNCHTKCTKRGTGAGWRRSRRPQRSKFSKETCDCGLPRRGGLS